MRTTTLLTAVPALTVMLVTGPAAVEAAEYLVNADRSVLAVRLFKAGLASAFAHDHVIHAADIEGTILWDPAQPSEARVAVDVDARSLVVDDPAMREKYGVGDALDDDTRTDIRETMTSAKQLDVERYPDMSFVSRDVRPTPAGGLEITGDLRLHGQTNSVTFTTAVEAEGDALRAGAEIRFLQSDFGIKPYRGMLGAVRNQDEAILIVELVATRVETPSKDDEPLDGGNRID
jgi:polyisoprenoid-binding protein YceI